MQKSRDPLLDPMTRQRRELKGSGASLGEFEQKRGVLEKRCKNYRWKQVHIVCTQFALQYFDSDEQVLPNGYVATADIEDIKHKPPANTSKEFHVHTKCRNRVYKFRAETNKDAHRWIWYIHQAVRVSSRKAENLLKDRREGEPSPEWISSFWIEHDASSYAEAGIQNNLWGTSVFEAALGNRDLMLKILFYYANDQELASLFLDIFGDPELADSEEGHFDDYEYKFKPLPSENINHKLRGMYDSKRKSLPECSCNSSKSGPKDEGYLSDSEVLQERRKFIASRRFQESKPLAKPDQKKLRRKNNPRRRHRRMFSKMRQDLRPRNPLPNQHYRSLSDYHSNASVIGKASARAKVIRSLGIKVDAKLTKSEKQTLYGWATGLATHDEAIKSAASLMLSPNPKIREIAIRLITLLLLVRAKREYVFQNPTEASGPNSDNVPAWVKKRVGQRLGIVLTSAFKRGKMKGEYLMRNVTVLLEMLCENIEDFSRNEHLNVYASSRAKTQRRSKTLKGQGIVHQPWLWEAVFYILRGSAMHPRKTCMKEISFILISHSENLRSLSTQRGWQTWLLPLLFDIPNSTRVTSWVHRGRAFTLFIFVNVLIHSLLSSKIEIFAKQLRESVICILSPLTRQSAPTVQMLLIAFATALTKKVAAYEWVSTPQTWENILHFVKLVETFVFILPSKSFRQSNPTLQSWQRRDPEAYANLNDDIIVQWKHLLHHHKKWQQEERVRRKNREISKNLPNLHSLNPNSDEGQDVKIPRHRSLSPPRRQSMASQASKDSNKSFDSRVAVESDQTDIEGEDCEDFVHPIMLAVHHNHDIGEAISNMSPSTNSTKSGSPLGFSGRFVTGPGFSTPRSSLEMSHTLVKSPGTPGSTTTTSLSPAGAGAGVSNRTWASESSERSPRMTPKSPIRKHARKISATFKQFFTAPFRRKPSTVRQRSNEGSTTPQIQSTYSTPIQSNQNSQINPPALFIPEHDQRPSEEIPDTARSRRAITPRTVVSPDAKSKMLQNSQRALMISQKVVRKRYEAVVNMQRAMQLQRHKGLKRRMRNYGDQWFEYLGGDINLLNKTAKLILTLKERHSRDSKKDGYTKQVRNLFRELEPLVEGGAFLSIIKDGRDNIPESLIRKMIKHFACHKHTSDSRRKIFKPFEAVRARRQTRRQRQEHLERLGVRTSSNSPTRRVPTNVFIAGTAQSGKSTILNQIRLIGKQGLLRDMYRGKWVDSICRNFTNLLFHARRLSSQGLVSMGRRSSESSWDEEGYRLVTTNGSEVELQNSVSLLSIEKMLHSESRTKDLTLLTAAKSAVLEVFSLDRKRREELQKTFTGSMNNIRAAKLNIEKIQNRRKEIISKSIIPKEIVKNWVSETLRWRFWVSPNLEGDVKKVEAFIADRIIGSTEVPKEITLSMDRLFHSPAIQRTLENRAEFQRNRLEPNVKYVLRKVRELGAQKRFVPSEQDILKIPARISDKTKIAAAMKVHSHVYTFQTLPQEGGSYGTKDVLLFVCDLEGFDHMLEHGRTSGLRDSAAKIQEEKRMTCKLKHQIEVFRELCEDETFKATSKVVALNKLDIFRKRIKQVPLSTIFPEFTGNPGDAEAAITFLCNQFVIVGKESRGHGMRRRTTQSTTPSMHSQASVMTTSRPSNPQNDIDSPRKRAMSSVEVVGLTATNRNSVVGILRRIIKSLD